MTKPIPPHRLQAPADAPLPPVPPDGGWEATRAQSMLATQIMREDGDEPGAAPRDIGRLVGNDEHELFVSCGAGEALLQQFDVLHPEFIAVHDIGCNVSRRLLAGVAAATGRRIQKLLIRRQGFGTPLARLEFVEFAGAQGSRALRLYSADVDADADARHTLTLALLGHSRLGVVLIGDLPSQNFSAALEPLQRAMLQGPWPNRQLLLLPLTNGAALAQQAAHLGSGSGVTVRVTPQVMRPAQAWAYLSSSWNRLRDSLGAEARHLPPLASVADPAADAAPAGAVFGRDPAPVAMAPPTPPLPLRPMPEVPKAGARSDRFEDLLADYAGRVLRLNGVLACCVFDVGTRNVVAQAGRGVDTRALARQGLELLAAAERSAEALDMDAGPVDLAITLAAHHLVLRPVPQHPSLMLHAVLDRSGANLTLARLQIQRLDEDFVL